MRGIELFPFEFLWCDFDNVGIQLFPSNTVMYSSVSLLHSSFLTRLEIRLGLPCIFVCGTGCLPRHFNPVSYHPLGEPWSYSLNSACTKMWSCSAVFAFPNMSSLQGISLSLCDVCVNNIVLWLNTDARLMMTHPGLRLPCAPFRLGSFPTELKVAYIVPVQKKGTAQHTENYRPISLLSVVSKIMERWRVSLNSGVPTWFYCRLLMCD